MSYLDHLYINILCGGTGTRVWPLSMKKRPKQFLNFFEDKTLFQGALFRALQIVPAERVIAITNAKYVDQIKKEAPEILPENIIAEPAKKNTAMAMGVATAWAYKKDPQAIVINLPSDHVVKDTSLFTKTMKAAAKVAFEQNKIITVGIEPAYPHPGFGYIKTDGQVTTEDDLPVSKVDSFKEKPDIETAKKYLAEGCYLWNAGFYIWKADILAQEFTKYSPQIAQNIDLATQGFLNNNKNNISKAYDQVEDVSIDIAIAEKTDKLLVMPGKFDWNDLGSWQVVYELGEKDKNQNVFVRNNEGIQNCTVETYDTTGSLIYSTNNPIAVVGLKDVVVVDTGSGILVCDRKKSNDVKNIVEQLKQKKLEDLI